MAAFFNRADELRSLERWWDARGASLAIVWGRRRVGKTALLDAFARSRRCVFYTGVGQPLPEELRSFARATSRPLTLPHRDLAERPFVDWSDALETLASAATSERLLVVLDEFPELVTVTPELPAVLRAFWDRARRTTKLKVLICGSAVRTMHEMQEERAPLYGRMDLSLLVHPFQPHEAAEFLSGIGPEERATVWGICDGVPLYLEWWDQSQSVRENLRRLVATPGGSLLNEGQLVLATEVERGLLPEQVLRAIALGRTKHNEIADAVRADPTRTLERLLELRLVERVAPVTEDPRRTRRRLYRIADNFLAFWLQRVEPYRTEIERGLGETILDALMADLDDHMGPPWEEAFRRHLRREAAGGRFGPDVVAIGPFWTTDSRVEIDAVALAGRERTAVLVGEAKWTKEVRAPTIVAELAAKSDVLPKRHADLMFAVAARKAVRDDADVVAVTARSIFGP